MIEIGFVDGKKTPMLLVQESPTEGRVLTNDEITYKVRFEFGGDVVDNIGLYGAFSTGV